MERCRNGKTWINTLENSRSVRALEMHVNGIKIVGSETFWAVFKKRRPEHWLPYEHFELYPRENQHKKVFKITVNPEKEVVLKKWSTCLIWIVNHT
jgi:hypothetical protein